MGIYEDLLQIIEGICSVLYLGGAVLFVIIGMLIINQSFRTKVKNLRYLGLFILFVGSFFIVSAIGQFITLDIITDTIFTIVNQISIYLSFTFAGFFVKETFHKENKRIYSLIIPIILIGFIATLLMEIYLVGKIFSALDALPFWMASNAITGIYISIIGVWTTHASNSAFRNVKLLDIEPAIKHRYKLFTISGVSFIIIGLVFAIPYSWLFNNELLSSIITLITSLNILIFNIVNYLIWMMPSKIREYFNKGYTPTQPDDKGLTEEEIMEQLKRGD